MTAKQVISRRELDESNGNMYKNKKTKQNKTHAKRAKVFFFIF